MKHHVNIQADENFCSIMHERNKRTKPVKKGTKTHAVYSDLCLFMGATKEAKEAEATEALLLS